MPSFQSRRAATRQCCRHQTAAFESPEKSWPVDYRTDANHTRDPVAQTLQASLNYSQFTLPRGGPPKPTLLQAATDERCERVRAPS